MNSRYESNAYRRYVLGVLTFVYAVNFIDRQLLSILQESIKLDLGLSDTQLGLLTGFAFAIFYVLAGIPIARLAERSNRRNIIAGSIGIWSIMTAVSGLAGNYWQLFMARIGVGVGEAGCSPPAHSIISDIYPPHQRASALSFYSSGVNVGIMLGILFGGFINEYFGWRVAFFVVGLPGVIVALILQFTVDEPMRGWSEKTVSEEKPADLKVVIKFIAERKYLVHISIAAGLSGLVGYGLINWMPSFFIRAYGMSTSEISVWMAVGVGLFGALGTFGWGVMCDRLGKSDKRWYLWLPALAVFMVIVPVLIIFTTHDKYTALIASLFTSFFTTAYLGATLAIFHGAVELRMRATASALYFLILNIVGLGCGPSLIGIISDLLNDRYGVDSLRYAILCVVPIACVWAMVHFLIAAKAMHEHEGS